MNSSTKSKQGPPNVRDPDLATVSPDRVADASSIAGCQKQPEENGAVPVKVNVLEPQEISVSTRFSGSVEPLQTTDLAFKLNGTVQSLYRPSGLNRDVQVGDTLEKGTVIAELDEGDLRRAKESAEATVAQLEARVVSDKESLDRRRETSSVSRNPPGPCRRRPAMTPTLAVSPRPANSRPQSRRW